MDKKSRLVFGLLLVIALASIGLTSYRTLALQDFVITEYSEEASDEEAAEDEVLSEVDLQASEAEAAASDVPATEEAE